MAGSLPGGDPRVTGTGTDPRWSGGVDRIGSGGRGTPAAGHWRPRDLSQPMIGWRSSPPCSMPASSAQRDAGPRRETDGRFRMRLDSHFNTAPFRPRANRNRGNSNAARRSAAWRAAAATGRKPAVTAGRGIRRIPARASGTAIPLGGCLLFDNARGAPPRTDSRSPDRIEIPS